MSAKLLEHEFKAVRLQIESDLSYEEVLRRLHERTGRAPAAEFNAHSASSSVEEFQRDLTERFLGTNDFMIFAEIDHGKWIERYGIHRRALRVILGNPLIAITMIRHDITAGLFAPVELLLVNNETGSGCTVHYVRPSTLIPTEGNAQMASAAAELDRKLATLIANITE